MITRNRSIIFFLITSLLLFSCGEKKTSENKKPKIVKEKVKLLSDVIVDNDLGISYQVPLSWKLMSAELSERYVARLNSEKFDGSFIVYHPKAFYFNSKISGLLRVGSIAESENSPGIELTIDNYIKLYKKFNTAKIIKREKINTGIISITQLVIEKSNLISLKNIFLNKKSKIVQFDYSLQQKDYDKEKEFITSSLASIKLL
ncbi:hypothetical protein MNBD_IGNAVI01-2036 [hydrothermal vent metagenome]|uniref:Lipoprotein n=1 Tax=hydrothermal vent metagenome TaxID=652676 RepID=A0A3B1C0T8_9ZZZZ